MRQISLVLCVWVSSSSQTSAQTPTKKPNIVFLLLDDLGYPGVGFNGGDIKTPHIVHDAERRPNKFQCSRS